MITGRPILVKRLHKCEIFHAILGSRSFSGSSTGFTNKTLTLDKENTKYLKYLYKIKDETFDLNYDVSLKRNVGIDAVKTTSYIICSFYKNILPKFLCQLYYKKQ